MGTTWGSGTAQLGSQQTVEKNLVHYNNEDTIRLSVDLLNSWGTKGQGPSSISPANSTAFVLCHTEGHSNLLSHLDSAHSKGETVYSSCRDLDGHCDHYCCSMLSSTSSFMTLPITFVRLMILISTVMVLGLLVDGDESRLCGS